MKSILLLTVISTLSLTSCDSFKQALASPKGKATLAHAEKLGKSIGRAVAINTLQISISEAQLYLTTLQTTPAGPHAADLILRTVEIASVQAGITAGQAKLKQLLAAQAAAEKNPIVNLQP